MNCIERLCEAINYPDRVGSDVGKFDLVVDGATVSATVDGGRMVLSRVLANDEDFGDGELGRLAGYAAGRAVKEEAVLSWDPESKVLILWQAVPIECETAQLRVFFDVFLTSCDWWAARIAEGATSGGKIPEMVFFP